MKMYTIVSTQTITSSVKNKPQSNEPITESDTCQSEATGQSATMTHARVVALAVAVTAFMIRAIRGTVRQIVRSVTAP